MPTKKLYPILSASARYDVLLPGAALESKSEQELWLVAGQAIPGWPRGTMVLTRRTYENIREGVLYFSTDGMGRGTLGLAAREDSPELYSFEGEIVRMGGTVDLQRVVGLLCPAEAANGYVHLESYSPYGYVFSGSRLEKAPRPERYWLNPSTVVSSFRDVYESMWDSYSDRRDEVGSQRDAVWMSISERPHTDQEYPSDVELPPSTVFGVCYPDPLLLPENAHFVRVFAFEPHEYGDFEEGKIYAALDSEGDALFATVREGCVQFREAAENEPFDESIKALWPSDGFPRNSNGSYRFLKLIGVFGHESPCVSLDGFLGD